MTDIGHTFVVQSDLTKLACDDVLVPTDAYRQVSPAFSRYGEVPVVDDWSDDGVRVTPPRPSVAGQYRCRWVNTGSTLSIAPEKLDWLLRGVRQALDILSTDSEGQDNLHRRSKRLVGLPAFGTGAGGFDAIRGAAIDGLLKECIRASTAYGYDIALVCWDRSDYSAIQARRSHLDDDGWSPLSSALLGKARRLGDQARDGDLALFFGAGISKPAGLPSWSDLVTELARESTSYRDRVDELKTIPPQDAVLLLKRDSPTRFDATLKRILTHPSHALGHALLASLQLDQTITTNFDSLYEQSCTRPFDSIGIRLLPQERAVHGTPWLLKMHGDVATPRTIVFSQADFLEFDTRWRPLVSLVQAAMMTRHVLFVGYSLSDQDFIRLSRGVSKLFEHMATDGLVGTVLTITDDPLLSDLWEGDLHTISVADASNDPAYGARALEIFLDYVGMTAAAQRHSYMLDPRYRALVSDLDRELVDDLQRIGEVLESMPAHPHWTGLRDALTQYGLPPSPSDTEV